MTAYERWFPAEAALMKRMVRAAPKSSMAGWMALQRLRLTVYYERSGHVTAHTDSLEGWE